jgi:hypothetical protein
MVLPEFAAVSYRNLRNFNGVLAFFSALALFLFYLGTRSDDPTLPQYFDLGLVTTFFLLPVLLLNLVEGRSPAAIPVMVIYSALGFLAVSAGEHAFERMPLDSFRLGGMAFASVAALALLVGRERGLEASPAFTGQRLDQRVRVDKLVRLRLVYYPQAGNYAILKPAQLFATCVVVRDISRTGIGFYGFPDDMETIHKCFDENESVFLEIIYEKHAYLVAADCRWLKSDLAKGNCGFRFVSPQEAESMVTGFVGPGDQLLKSGSKPASQDSVFPRVFGAVLWSYSVFGFIALIL